MIETCIFCGTEIFDPCLNYDGLHNGDGLIVLGKFICDDCIPKIYDILFNEWNIKGI